MLRVNKLTTLKPCGEIIFLLFLLLTFQSALGQSIENANGTMKFKFVGEIISVSPMSKLGNLNHDRNYRWIVDVKVVDVLYLDGESQLLNGDKLVLWTHGVVRVFNASPESVVGKNYVFEGMSSIDKKEPYRRSFIAKKLLKETQANHKHLDRSNANEE